MKNLVLDQEQTSAKSRIAALRLSMLTLRLMENWTRELRDHDSALILAAVVAIGAERLTRAPMDPALKDLSREIPTEQLATCNLSSIAEATSLNRETVRRKVNRLIADGYLMRTDGGVRMDPAILQRPMVLELVRQQLETLMKTVNELIREGVFRLSDRPS